MRAYIIRRLLLIGPTLLAVTIAVFMTVRFIPGSAIDQIVAQITGGSDTDPKVVATYIRHELGLDKPLQIQYLRWMGLMKQDDGRYSGVLQGDLGHSLWQQ